MVARPAVIASLVIAGVARATESEQDLVARARGIHERVIADCRLNSQSAIPKFNPQSAIRNPQSAIRNPQSAMSSAPVPQHHRGFLIDDERFDELVRCPGARDVDANGQDTGGAALQVDHVL